MACELLVGAMWDLVPCLGIELRTSALGVQSPSHWTIREVVQWSKVEVVQGSGPKSLEGSRDFDSAANCLFPRVKDLPDDTKKNVLALSFLLIN